jgi:hypothetical protein
MTPLHEFSDVRIGRIHAPNYASAVNSQLLQIWISLASDGCIGIASNRSLPSPTQILRLSGDFAGGIMQVSSARLLVFIVIAMGITLSTAHPQTQKPPVTPLGPGADGKCCVCQSSTGSPFMVSGAGGSQSCSSACAASGGTATGSMASCVPPTPLGPGGYQTTNCLSSIDGGDCGGNNWCHCGQVRVKVWMGDGNKEFPDDASSSDEYHTDVGAFLRFHAIIHGYSGSESPNRTALAKGASLIIDGPIPTAPGEQNISTEVRLQIYPGETPANHNDIRYDAQYGEYKFDKPGRYRVWVQVWGAYKWDDRSGSCSYECVNPYSRRNYVPPLDFLNAGLFVIVDKPKPHDAKH